MNKRIAEFEEKAIESLEKTIRMNTDGWFGGDNYLMRMKDMKHFMRLALKHQKQEIIEMLEGMKYDYDEPMTYQKAQKFVRNEVLDQAIKSIKEMK